MGLLSAGIALALSPMLSLAQDSDSAQTLETYETSEPSAVTEVAQVAANPRATEATTLDRIEVTGSRIRQAGTETAQPIIVMSRAEIQKQGYTSVADIIQNLSTTGSPSISRSEALASGEEVGGQYVDLRNLGPERTLVLLDGKRMGITSSGYSDLAAVPTAVIERIEVLTDGASAIYGSDAIAGVINIITRKNFDGFEASATFGQYGQGDGDKQSFSFVSGSAGERSSVMFGAEYSDEKPVYAKDRRYSAYNNGQWHPFPTQEGPNGWSAITEKGVMIDPAGNRWTLNPGGDPTNMADYHMTTAEDYSNPTSQMFLSTGVTRRSVFASGDYELTDNVRAKADALYTHRETLQQIAGYPYRSSTDRWHTPLSGDSYFNPLGEDVEFMRRTWEVPRQTASELTTYRFSAGLEGAFELGGNAWDWEVGYLYNQNKGLKTSTGNLFTPHVRNATGASFMDTDGIVKCGTPGAVIEGCIPWNPLLPYGQAGHGSLSDPELQQYLFARTQDTSETTTQVYSATIAGTLAELPAGALGLAAGIEHRRERAEFTPDAMSQTGLNTDLAGAPTRGGYSLDEAYLELAIPLLAGVPGAQELSVNIAGRYSDYSSFGDTTNGKFTVKWKPIDDLLVRGTYATGFRAPTVSNLYGGVSETFENYTDPCDTYFGSATRNPEVAARCAAHVPGDFRQEASGGVDASNPQSQSNYPYLSGSNPDLKPETSRSLSFGAVYSPQSIQGLDVSLDWWKIKIDDVISNESVTSILNQCYVQNIAAACHRFVRDETSGQVTNITRNLTNGGYQETAGYDLGVRYRLPETAVGRFTVDWKTTYVDYLSYKRDNESTTPVEQHTGWATSDWGSNFRVRSNLNLEWEKGSVGASWRARYYSGTKEECAYEAECDAPDYSSPYTYAKPVRHTGSNTFHDLQVRWNASWDATIALGANNVFDHEGPVMYSQPNSNFSYHGSFDIGRFVYLQYQQRF
jgi:iron complex outermembrane receptor protein